MNPIGGYFELEKTVGGGNFPQKNGILLNTGRNALEYILVSLKKVSKVYIPFYTCEVVLEPFDKLGIEYVFYRINEKLEIEDDVTLNSDEYLLYTNYFGVKDMYVYNLACRFGERLIVDCAQALYCEHLNGIKMFYSPRKFVGIPDGAVAFVENGKDTSLFDFEESENRMSHLYLRLERGPQAGYSEFRINAAKLKNQPILNMSTKTRDMIDQIDFDIIKKNRLENFRFLHNRLKDYNRLSRILNNNLDSFACPMVYPYWTDDKDLKSRLIKEQVFVATYWPNVLDWTNPDMIEYELANNCLAIPCDQRYGENEMDRIINIIIG